MAWTAPMTAVAGSVFTAAQFNTYIRDNLNECPAAKATTPGSLFVTSDTNQIAERVPTSSAISGSQTTTSTTYADLGTVGPQVTVTTGVSVLVWISSFAQNSTSGAQSNVSFDITGATSTAASDVESIRLQANSVNDFFRAGICSQMPVTPGSNTFTMKYRVSGGTGTFANRSMTVLPL